MDDIQSWSEVPSIAHFCSLFRAAFNLLDFDIEELEEALLTDGAEDSGSSLLQELIVRLLCGCIQSNDISTFNYQMFLRRLFRQKCHEYGRENPFNTDIDFQFLPLRTKVEILHALCDFRLDADDVQDLLKNLESDSLRVEPLGHDEKKSAYWYFYGTRLYREDFPKSQKKRIRDKRRKSKDDKKRKKKNKTCYESDIEDDLAPGVWQVVCYTEEDWENLAQKFKGSTCKDEKDLHRTLTEDFLPEIPRLFAEKERLQRKRMMEFQPRRQSSRLEKLKQKEEEEKILAREEEEKLKLEKEERERRERLVARAVRAFHRGSPKSGSDCGSYRSERDKEGNEGNGRDNNLLSVGRQTNNSLASATGQIIIQPPRRKKLRSKQVFKTSAEDLRTGMYKILDYIKNHDEAWPFVDPVDENYAPRYYSVIRKPMDLQRMEEKLDSGEYLTFNDFRNDFQLIVDNCRQYNGSENEYTEMVQNLQEAFQEAADRYLESDPSSDEEVAVEYPPVFEEQKGRSEIVKKKRKLKRKAKDPNKDKENKKKRYDSEDSDSKPPSLKPQGIRSPLSEKSGSIPGSDFDDREPDFLREHSPPRLVKATEMDANEDSSSDSRLKSSAKSKGSKLKRGTGVIKNVAAIEALSLATEQTLKDINKWLDDTPRSFSEFSFTGDSPSNIASEDEFGSAGNRNETECKKSTKTEKPFRTKDKDGVKKRKTNEVNKPVKRKEVQRTIERLQPGKSKGNLIANLPKAKENAEEMGLSMGLTLNKLNKESRNALLVKTDETAPKLSLGTVLKSDIIGFGVNKHNFDENEKMDATEDVDKEPDKVKSDVKPIEGKPFDRLVPKSPEIKSEIEKDDQSKNTDTDEVESSKDEDSKSGDGEERKREGLKETTNKAKPTPNLSAWFKAFGAPKTVSNIKKKTENNEPFSTPARSCSSPLQEIKPDSSAKMGNDGNDAEKTWFNDSSRNSPSSGTSGYFNKDKIEAPSSVELDEPKSVSVASPMPSPDLRPGSASSLGQPLSNLPPAPRQRKASTSSSMSERSSFSQDPLDGSSPHLSMDERLGGYPAPYPSPLHRSPIVASPIMASPKGEDLNKGTYASINGTIRVGFYQDTSSNLQKSSPEKQSPNSNSPRDQSNCSPFQSYSSPHVYPPTPSQNTNISKVYGQSPHSASNPYSAYQSPTSVPISTTSSGFYDNLPQYSLSSMMNYTDQTFRNSSRSSRENYDFSPKPVSYSSPETAKPPSSVFPVKKRVYAEIESGRLQIMNESTPKFPEPQRNLGPTSQTQCDPNPSRNMYADTRPDNSMPYSRLQQPEMPLPQPGPQYDRFAQQKFQPNEVPKLIPDPSTSLSISQPPPEQNVLQKPKYRLPSPDNSRNLGNIMDNLTRLQQQTMSVGNPMPPSNRHSLSNSMESAGLGRLLQPPVPKNTITEDHDGVFRNKYPSGMENLPKMPQQQSYQQEEEKRMMSSSSVNLGRVQPNVNTTDQRPPCSMPYQTPNLSSISHMVDRYQVEERLMQQSAFYPDKSLVNIYGKNVSGCGPIYSQSGLNKVATNPSVTVPSQMSYSREQELNIPKPAMFTEAKKSRKKQPKTAEVPPATTGTTTTANTAFQQYVKSNEPPAISLKTASVVPGSAFNFGPPPTSLGLTNPLYTEKDAYGGFLEDLRTQPSTYYSMVAAATHRSQPDSPTEKPANPAATTNAFPFLGHPQTRTSGYPPIPQFVNSHQPPLMDPATASSPLYQQYIQRLQEEQLRHTGVLHQGLLGPSSGYAPGYHHPALGIPRQSYDRPSWL